QVAQPRLRLYLVWCSAGTLARCPLDCSYSLPPLIGSLPVPDSDSYRIMLPQHSSTATLPPFAHLTGLRIRSSVHSKGAAGDHACSGPCKKHDRVGDLTRLRVAPDR